MTKLENTIAWLKDFRDYFRERTRPGYNIEFYGCNVVDKFDEVLELLKAKEHENELSPFDVLNIISSAYGGKQIFFQEKNGIIYDRYEAEYVTLEEAVYRMARRVGDDGDC